jgi:hypothetical protein
MQGLGLESFELLHGFKLPQQQQEQYSPLTTAAGKPFSVWFSRRAQLQQHGAGHSLLELPAAAAGGASLEQARG